MDEFEFEKILKEMKKFQKRMLENMLKDVRKIDELTKVEDLGDEWEVTPIKGPDVRGFIAQRRLQTSDSPSGPVVVKDRTREPLIDFLEEDDAVKIYVEVPGVEKDQIQIEVADNVLDIRAGEKFHVKKRIPSGLDVEKASSSYRNGVLELVIPRTQTLKSGKKRKIELQ